MNDAPHTPLSEADLDQAERRALAAAVAEALADPRPSIPHEVIEAEVDAEIEALERLIVAKFPPAAGGSFGVQRHAPTGSASLGGSPSAARPPRYGSRRPSASRRGTWVHSRSAAGPGCSRERAKSGQCAPMLSFTEWSTRTASSRSCGCGMEPRTERRSSSLPRSRAARRSVKRAARTWLGLSLLATSCTGPVPGAAPDPAARDQLVSVPLTEGTGHLTHILARLCRPAGDAPARLVVINHGSPTSDAERITTPIHSCSDEAAQWFLSRGNVVMFPLRRGYGATGGGWQEGYGGCARADYHDAGLTTARDINAAVDYATTLPFVRPDGAVVVGQSAGGWGVIAYDSVPHPRVSAFVVFAGGRGGHILNISNNSCHPDHLVEAAGRYARTASTPMLWVYAQNDTFFAPPLAEAMHRAFTDAGGKATLVQPGPFPVDGHNLFFGQGGSAVWGPIVDRYLAATQG